MLLFYPWNFHQDKKWLWTSRSSYFPAYNDASVASSSTHRLSMCILHAHPEGRGVKTAHSQHILPFHLNSWALQTATITAFCNKEMWRTQAQPSPWLQWSKLASHCETKCQPRLPSAGWLSADKDILQEEKINNVKKIYIYFLWGLVALNLELMANQRKSWQCWNSNLAKAQIFFLFLLT